MQHIDIMEPPKFGAAGSHLRLSTPLHIPCSTKLRREDCTFEDLDEVYSRYVQPYMKCINDVKANKKFLLMPRDKLDTTLAQVALGYDYRIGLMYDKPGLGYISWTAGPGQKGHKVHHCHFSVTHLGYFIAMPSVDGQPVSKHVRNVNSLVDAFKKQMQSIMKAQVDRQQHHSRGREDRGGGHRGAGDPYPPVPNSYNYRGSSVHG